MKKVVMFGGAGTKSPVPPIVEGVERWTINNLICMPEGPARFKGHTRHFDLHHKEHIVGRKRMNMWGQYAGFHIPVYLWTAFPDLRTSCAYPREAVQAMFGGTRLFTSTLDWLVAAALFEHFKEIELYGFRMRHPRYLYQVGSGRWWLKQCADRGVKVTHLSPSALARVKREVEFKPPLPESHHLMYGFDTTDRSKLYHGR